MRPFGTRLSVMATALFAATGVRGQTPYAQTPYLQAFIFGDAVFTVQDQDVADGFRLGQMVAHANASLTERVTRSPPASR